VTPAPHPHHRRHEFIETALRRRILAGSLRALDATPARETLMKPIMFNATAPVGCASDLTRLGH